MELVNTLNQLLLEDLCQECHRMMEAQGHSEPVGRVKSTGAYHLPSQWVFHTVGPLVQDTHFWKPTGSSWPPAIGPAWSWRQKWD